MVFVPAVSFHSISRSLCKTRLMLQKRRARHKDTPERSACEAAQSLLKRATVIKRDCLAL